MRTQLLIISILSLVFLATGCGKDSPTFSNLPVGQIFKQNKAIFNNQLDILWVIDNSGSMDPYQTNLVNNFSSFISNFQTKGYDFHIAVTTSEAYLADPTLSGYSSGNSSLAKFRDGLGSSHTGVFVILPTTPNLNNVFVTNATQGSGGSGDERAFSSMKTALSSSLNTSFSFLRQTSFLAVIILSDEDDFSGNGRCQYCGNDHDYNASTLDSVNNYVSYLDQLTATTGAFRRYNVSTIAAIDSACQQSHASTGSIIGQRYLQMVNATNGTAGSICDASYANALNSIQAKIAELSTQFFLDKTPLVSSISVKVNGAVIANDASNGWTYNSTTNSIVFHGSAVPPQNATIAIDYVPASLGG